MYSGNCDKMLNIAYFKYLCRKLICESRNAFQYGTVQSFRKLRYFTSLLFTISSFPFEFSFYISLLLVASGCNMADVSSWNLSNIKLDVIKCNRECSQRGLSQSAKW